MMFGMDLTWKNFLQKCGKYPSSLPTDYDRFLSVSSNYLNFKDNFPNHKQKNNVSLNPWHEVFIKILNIFLLITNKNRGIIQNQVRIREKVRLSIFELN